MYDYIIYMFEKLIELFIMCCKHKKIHSSCCEVDIDDKETIKNKKIDI
jgi:hypothetical protein